VQESPTSLRSTLLCLDELVLSRRRRLSPLQALDLLGLHLGGGGAGRRLELARDACHVLLSTRSLPARSRRGALQLSEQLPDASSQQPDHPVCG
jgi:hypothetical protein